MKAREIDIRWSTALLAFPPFCESRTSEEAAYLQPFPCNEVVRNLFCLPNLLGLPNHAELLVWWQLRVWCLVVALAGAGLKWEKGNGKGVCIESGYEQGVDGLIRRVIN